MRTLVVNLLRLGGMQAVIAGTAIVRNKVLALRLGEHGFGEFSQLALLALSIGVVVAFGFGMSLNRNVAAEPTAAGRQRLLAQANAVLLALAGVIALVVVPLLVWRGDLLGAAGLEASPAVLTAAFVLLAFVPLDAAVQHRVAFLTGALDIRGMTAGRSKALAAGTVVGVPIVWWFGLPGAALQLLLITALIVGFLDRRLRQTGFRPWAVTFDGPTFRLLVGLGAASLVAGFVQQWSDVVVRSALIRTVDAAQNGLYQAALSTTYQVKAIVLGSVGSYSIAELSRDASRERVDVISKDLLQVVLPIAGIALAVLGMLSGPALLVLYAPSFLPAQSVFPYLLTADFLHVAIWVVGAPLLATHRTARWLTYELVFAGTRAATGLLLVPTYGMVGVAVGYLAATGLHLVVNVVTFTRLLGYRLPLQGVVLFLSGAALVGASAVLGSLAGSDLRVYVLGMGLVGAFAAVSLHVVVGIPQAYRWLRDRRGGRR